MNTGSVAPPEAPARFAQIALPLPLASSYTYRIPETLADRVVPGARVVVPVRRRELIGIVVSADAPAPHAQPRDILAAHENVEVGERPERHIAVSLDGQGRPLEGKGINPLAREQVQESQ